MAALNPKATFDDALFSTAELKSGDTQSIVDRFNLSRKAAKELKDEVASGKDVFLALDGYLTRNGITADILGQRLQGTAGKKRELTIATEDLKLALGSLVEGPGTLALGWLTRMTQGLTELATAGQGNNKIAQDQANAAALASGSYAEYTAKLQQFKSANAGVFYTMETLTAAQLTYLHSLSQAEQKILLQTGAIYTLTAAQLAYVASLPVAAQAEMATKMQATTEQTALQSSAMLLLAEAEIKIGEASPEMNRAAIVATELAAAFPTAAGAVANLSDLFNSGLITLEEYNAGLANINTTGTIYTASELAAAQATQDASDRRLEAAVVVQDYASATERAQIAEDLATASARQHLDIVTLLIGALGEGATALDVQANSAIISAAQHDALKIAQQNASIAATDSLTSYLAAGGAISEMGLKALITTGALEDLITAMAIAQGKQNIGLGPVRKNNGIQRNGQKKKATLIELGYDPTQEGLHEAVGDAARRITDPAGAAATDRQNKSDADAFNKIIADANESARRLTDAGKSKDQLLKEARALLPKFKVGSKEWIRIKGQIDGFEADIKSDAAKPGKAAAGGDSRSQRQKAEDGLATAGEDIKTQLAYWQKELAKVKPDSVEAIKIQKKIKDLKARIGTQAGKDATKDGRQAEQVKDAQTRNDIAGMTDVQELAYWKNKIKSMKVGGLEYLAASTKIKELTAQVNQDLARSGEKTRDDQTRNDIAGLSDSQELAYWREKIKNLKAGSSAYVAASTRIKELTAKVNQDSARAGDQTRDAETRRDVAGLGDAQELAYWKSKLKSLKAGSLEYLAAETKIRELTAKVNEDAARKNEQAANERQRNAEKAAADRERLADAKLGAELAGKDKASQLAIYTRELRGMKNTTEEYWKTLAKIRDLEADVANERERSVKALNDAALAKIRDQQSRYKEDKEIAVNDRILASSKATADQKEQARLRNEEIRLEREGRALDIAGTAREAGQQATAGTPPVAMPAPHNTDAGVVRTLPRRSSPTDGDRAAFLGAAAAKDRMDYLPFKPDTTTPDRSRMNYLPFKPEATPDRNRMDYLPFKPERTAGAPPTPAAPPAIEMKPAFQVHVSIGGKRLVEDLSIQIVDEQRRAWNVSAGGNVNGGDF